MKKREFDIATVLTVMLGKRIGDIELAEELMSYLAGVKLWCGYDSHPVYEHICSSYPLFRDVFEKFNEYFKPGVDTRIATNNFVSHYVKIYGDKVKLSPMSESDRKIVYDSYYNVESNSYEFKLRQMLRARYLELLKRDNSMHSILLSLKNEFVNELGLKEDKFIKLCCDEGLVFDQRGVDVREQFDLELKENGRRKKFR